jgi:hypothetical protein
VSEIDDRADREQRAAFRRAHWTGGVARGHAEMAVANAEFWRGVSGDDKLGYVFDMWAEQMKLKDPTYEAPARLQRSVGGVRPRRG